jgi:hypothetical protein
MPAPPPVSSEHVLRVVNPDSFVMLAARLPGLTWPTIAAMSASRGCAEAPASAGLPGGGVAVVAARFVEHATPRNATINAFPFPMAQSGYHPRASRITTSTDPEWIWPCSNPLGLPR